MRASGTRRSHVPELWDAPASDWGAPHRSRTLQLLRRRVIFYKKSATKFQLSSTSHRGAKLQRLELAKRKRRPTTTAPNLLGFFLLFSSSTETRVVPAVAVWWRRRRLERRPCVTRPLRGPPPRPSVNPNRRRHAPPTT